MSIREEGENGILVRRTTHRPRVCVCAYGVRKTRNDNDEVPKNADNNWGCEKCKCSPKNTTAVNPCRWNMRRSFRRFHDGPPSRQRNNAAPSCPGLITTAISHDTKYVLLYSGHNRHTVAVDVLPTNRAEKRRDGLGDVAYNKILGKGMTSYDMYISRDVNLHPVLKYNRSQRVYRVANAFRLQDRYTAISFIQYILCVNCCVVRPV